MPLSHLFGHHLTPRDVGAFMVSRRKRCRRNSPVTRHRSTGPRQGINSLVLGFLCFLCGSQPLYVKQRLESYMDLHFPKPGAFSISSFATKLPQIRQLLSPFVHLDPAAMPRFKQGTCSRAGGKPHLPNHRLGLWSLDTSPLSVLPVSGMKWIFKGLCGSPALSHPGGGQPLALCSQTM